MKTKQNKILDPLIAAAILLSNKSLSTWPCTILIRDVLAEDELARHGMDDSQLPLSYNSPPNTSLTCPADGSATQLSHPVSQLGHIGRVSCSAC